MKPIYLLLILSLVSCKLTHFPHIHLYESKIERVSMSLTPDTTRYFLTEQQSQELVDLVNHSKTIGPAKYMKKYTINIQFPNDSTLLLYCSDTYFSQNNIHTHQIKRENYFDELWEQVRNSNANP